MIQKIVIYIIKLFDFFHHRKIFSFLNKKNLINFNIFFDVGAHKGESIKLFLKHLNIKEIVSFEASPITFEYLKKKETSFNKRFKNTKIKLENLALGSEKKSVILKHMSESSSSTISQINKNSSYFKKKYKLLNFFDSQKLYAPVEVKLETLENYIVDNEYKTIDFLKIDTEGYEYEILLGLNKKLKDIKLIMFEHHYDNMIKKNYSYSDIKNLLEKYNFKMIFKAKMPLRKTFEYIFINTDGL